MSEHCEICGLPRHSGVCDRYQLMHVVRQLRDELRVKGLELAATKKLDGDNVISITSLVSHRTERPRVDIQVGEIHTQVDAQKAIEVGHLLIEGALGGYADAFLFHWAKEKTGIGDPQAAALLSDFREYRDNVKSELEGR